MKVPPAAALAPADAVSCEYAVRAMPIKPMRGDSTVPDARGPEPGTAMEVGKGPENPPAAPPLPGPLPLPSSATAEMPARWRLYAAAAGPASGWMVADKLPGRLTASAVASATRAPPSSVFMPPPAPAVRGAAAPAAALVPEGAPAPASSRGLRPVPVIGDGAG
jgi:hypothetical protein